MEHSVETRIDLVTLASSVSTLKSSPNIELIAVASLITLKEILKVLNKPWVQYGVDVGMTRSGFLNEWRELLKVYFSKVEVVVIFFYLACANGVKQKQNIDYLNFLCKG
jgi:hypothetical protein